MSLPDWLTGGDSEDQVFDEDKCRYEEHLDDMFDSDTKDQYPDDDGFDDFLADQEDDWDDPRDYPEKDDSNIFRFTEEEDALLEAAHVDLDHACKYSERFSAADIIHMIDNKVSFRVAEDFHEAFDGHAIVSFVDGEYDYWQVNRHPDMDPVMLIDILDRKRYSREPAIIRADQIRRTGQRTILDSEVPATVELDYQARFAKEQVIDLYRQDCSSEQANAYLRRFKGREVIALVSANCPSYMANEYPRQFNGFEVGILHRMGVKPNDIKTFNASKLAKLFKRVFSYKKIKYNSDNFTFIGLGASGVVLLSDGVAWKFSKDIVDEYELLMKVQSAYSGKQKNVIKVLGEPQNRLALEIEYVPGKSLEDLVRIEGALSSEKVLKYAAGILNGLHELRCSGIREHHDLRPANILIDSDLERPVIIDLEWAASGKYTQYVEYAESRNSGKQPKINRRYGGPSDLVSLGQIMYYMATTYQIFDKSQSQSRTFGSVLQFIMDERTVVYSDPTGKALEPYLAKVKAVVKDPRISGLINLCLRNENNDYTSVKQMIEGIGR